MIDDAEKDYQRFVEQLPPPTHQPRDCRHEEFAAFVACNRLEDTGLFNVDVRVLCRHCREPFRFLGLEPGYSPRVPRVSIDGVTANLPMEPEIEKRLFGGARFEMPAPPGTRH